MSTAFRLLLPRHFYDAMIAQARAEMPNECCGILAGSIDGVQGLARVEARYPLVNEQASPVEFTAEPRSMFAAQRAMHRDGLDMLVVYHSHPTSAPIPSKKDRDRNYWEMPAMILSMLTDPPEVGYWWLNAEGHGPLPWELVDVPLHNTRTVSVSIACPPGRVYRFVSNPQNLPAWAPAFFSSVRKQDDRWLAETTLGEIAICFAAANTLGVLDHVVTLPDGTEVNNPMRVIANAGGSEVLFTLVQQPNQTDTQFAADAATVQHDLNTLKQVLEQ